MNSSTDVSKIAQEFSLGDSFSFENDVKITGGSGVKHHFDLVVTSKEDEKVKVACLRGTSHDLIDEIMRFNAMASDCSISLKALLVARNLDEVESNLAQTYNISVLGPGEGIEAESLFGIDSLDTPLRGIMRKGNVYMLSGGIGTGKTTLSTQFIVQGAKGGERGAIILTDTRGEEYISCAKSFSFKFGEYYKQGMIEVLDLSKNLLELKDRIKGNLNGARNYVHAVTRQIADIVAEYNIRRLVIDPVTPLIIEDNDFINLFVNSLTMKPTYVLMTSGLMKSDLSVYGLEEYYVSGLIKLEEDAENKDIKKASIVKMRGGTFDPKPYLLRICTDGMVPYREEDYSTKPLFRRVLSDSL